VGRWGGWVYENNIFHSVKQSRVLAIMNIGELSIKNPIIMNKVLGPKLAWGYIASPSPWWKKITKTNIS